MQKLNDFWTKAKRRPTTMPGMSLRDWGIAVACGAAIWAGFIHHNSHQLAIALCFLVVLIYKVAESYGFNRGADSVEKEFARAAKTGENLEALVKRQAEARRRQAAFTEEE